MGGHLEALGAPLCSLRDLADCALLCLLPTRSHLSPHQPCAGARHPVRHRGPLRSAASFSFFLYNAVDFRFSVYSASAG